MRNTNICCYRRVWPLQQPVSLVFVVFYQNIRQNPLQHKILPNLLFTAVKIRVDQVAKKINSKFRRDSSKIAWSIWEKFILLRDTSLGNTGKNVSNRDFEEKSRNQKIKFCHLQIFRQRGSHFHNWRNVIFQHKRFLRELQKVSHLIFESRINRIFFKKKNFRLTPTHWLRLG